MEEGNKNPFQIQNKQNNEISLKELLEIRALFLEIASRLDIRSLASLAQTNKMIYALFQDDVLLKKFLTTYFLIKDPSSAKVEENSQQKVTFFQQMNQYFQEHYKTSNPHLTKQVISFFLDVIEGNAAAVKAAIEADENIINFKNSVDQLPLELACWKGHLELIDFIIDAHMKQFRQRDTLQMVLHKALNWAVDYGQVKAVNFIAEKAANFSIKHDYYKAAEADESSEEFKAYKQKIFSELYVSFINEYDTDMETALHKAAGSGQLEVAKFLIKNKAKIDSINEDGETPLHKAAARGHLEMFKFLITNGANITNLKVSDARGKTLLDKAYLGGIEWIKFLIDFIWQNDHTKTHTVALDAYEAALNKAVLANNFELVKFLINFIQQNHPAKTLDECKFALKTAALCGCSDLVKALIDFIWQNDHTKTHTVALDACKIALEEAAYGKDNFIDGEFRYFEVVKVLFNFFEQNDKTAALYVCNTVFHKAAEDGHLEIIEFLIEKDIDINSTDKHGETALHKAARCAQLEVVKVLIANGANHNLKNNAEKTPLDIAVENGHNEVVAYLNEVKQKHQSTISSGEQTVEEIMKGLSILAVNPSSVPQSFFGSSAPKPGNNNSNPATSSLPIDPNQHITKEGKEEEEEEDEVESLSQAFRSLGNSPSNKR